MKCCWNLFLNAIGVVTFLFVDANEVITIDNKSWIFIHLYVVQGWKWISLLTCVEKFDVQHITKNDFHFMIIAMVTYGVVKVLTN
jgi:hypothetical protein